MRPFNKALRPKFTPARLFAAGAQGAWYDPSSLWGASDHLPRRNLLTNTVFAGAVAGTPGTAPTGWAQGATGGTMAVSGEVLTLSTAGAARQWVYWNTLITLVPGVYYTFSAEITAVSGAASDTVMSFGLTAGSVTGTTVVTVSDGTGRKSLTFTSAAGATGYVRLGAGVSLNTVGAASVSFKEPMFATTATLDQSYQKITDWTTEQYAHAASKNVPWLRRNRFLNTATLSTQTVSSVTATPLTVSFAGTGTITFSTAYVGSLVGTGASDRVTATFTPAAGNLVCTVTGSVTLAQCEVGSTATTYQPIGASWEATYAANAAAAGVVPTLYQDSAGTTPVTGPDSVIGKLNDLSGGGYHAVQTGATGLKPTLRLNSNGYWWLQRDLSDDALVTTFPNLGSNCVAYRAEELATVADTGVTLNGALTVNTPATDYGRIYLNAPSSKDAQIRKWLDAKRGGVPVNLGPEILSTTTNITAWTNTNAQTSHTANTFVTTAAAGGITYSGFTAGRKYLVTVTGSCTDSNFSVNTADAATEVAARTVQNAFFGQCIFAPTAAQPYLYLRVTLNQTATITFISVREIL